MNEPELMTIKEAAESFGKSTTAIYQLIKKNGIEPQTIVRDGKKIKAINPSDLGLKDVSNPFQTPLKEVSNPVSNLDEETARISENDVSNPFENHFKPVSNLPEEKLYSSKNEVSNPFQTPFQTSAAAMEREIEALKAVNAVLEARIADKETTITTLNADKSFLQDQLIRAQSDRDRMQMQLYDVQAKLALNAPADDGLQDDPAEEKETAAARAGVPEEDEYKGFFNSVFSALQKMFSFSGKTDKN